MANDERTGVDPEVLATPPDLGGPSTQRPEPLTPPRRPPTGTPAVPLSSSAKPLVDPSTALPNFTMLGTRAPTAIPSVPRVTTIPSVPRAKTGHDLPRANTEPRAATARAITTTPRAPTRPPPLPRAITGAHPIVGRAPTGRAPTERAATAPAGIAPSDSRPTPARTPVDAVASIRAVDRAATAPASYPVRATRAPTAEELSARTPGSTVIPIPPIATPRGVRAPTSKLAPSSPAIPLPAGIQARVASSPAIARTSSSPAIPVPPASISSGVHRVPTMIDPDHATHGSQPAAARLAAALPAPPHVVSPVVRDLPPYVPAPNVGDPGEVIETVRVETVELTELVEKYAPLPGEHAPVIATTPRRSLDRRAVGGVLVRFAPLLAAIAILLIFVIGYVIFDGEGRRGPTMTTVHAPLAEATTSQVAPAPAPAPSVPAVATADDATPTDNANAVPPEPEPEPAVAPAPVPEKPRPVRGKIYITSNKTAQIFLDGRSASATTPRQLYVTPGFHKVTLWDTASGKTHTQVVKVAADAVVTVRKKFD